MFDTKHDYNQVFTQRGHMYNRASKRYPLARDTERRLILDRLDLRAGQTVCDAPAGGGYVAAGVAGRFGDAGIGVKTLPARPTRRAPYRLLRIERRFSGHFIEQFTHSVFDFRRSVIICKG